MADDAGLLTPLHVGEGAVVGVLEGHPVVREDHVVVHRREDVGHEGLADLATVAVAVAVQEFVEGLDTGSLQGGEGGGRNRTGRGGASGIGANVSVSLTLARIPRLKVVKHERRATCLGLSASLEAGSVLSRRSVTPSAIEGDIVDRHGNMLAGWAKNNFTRLERTTHVLEVRTDSARERQV